MMPAMWFFQSPLRTALLAQAVGSFLAWTAIELAYPKLFAIPLAAAAVQGLCTALVSHKLEAPRWWTGIHLAFLPLVVAVGTLHIPPWIWLASFVTLLLLFWRTDKSQVPLYLSNRLTAEAVVELLPPEPCAVIDLGCGTGGFLRQLAIARPDCRFTGVEHAPIPWLLAWIQTRGFYNVTIYRGDLWATDLRPFRAAYAFLSPVPMPRLWAKAQAEMAEDSLLVSNSFQIPEATPESITEVEDSRETHLYCYRPKGNSQ